MSARLFLSSGDLIADRRFDFARDLQLRGDLVAAADLMEQAVELAPNFASAWFALGELRQELNLHDAAIAAYRRACAADPDDRHGARLRLIRLGAEPLAEMSPEYVRALFDQYAPKFDTALRGDLNYRGPEILQRAVLAARHAAGKPASFRHALDLGCGTGLAGRIFAGTVETIDGFDLSPGMLAQARATGIYTRLGEADMVAALRDEPVASADLVLAADAMVYLGDLAPLCGEVARVLTPGGVFAFTVEAHAGDGFSLGAGLRYTHSEPYLRDVVRAAGLVLSELSEVSTRTDGGVPVPGYVAVADKP
ncbi:methyltransferase domain-containing protein [Bradyrhizobium sp. U87765 SZCCT0131]|uniref:class I SAM-dependent DNA methyltransferase n=1 Tax=unclassified Bradyrhizobium TaxID=2631580 RepID=UPI001BA522AE|nr:MULTISPECIES: methyltransferase domain-containing protein [unclassified Bradyrhizobium]MBR1221021.1 methyltransferase domain-containing protein [Bradyrhizobium sp. U87765 SZCCT0131]MBR1260159.1 methyltransferase domain-containing protein [Bradyrhizobium sp. U87765 SZCCT0134]MBR1307592.1 methyltransferase domain-containing protein [Bradyrhizobium sp. U87765 SZCCT0110]MBR1321546.1 methyltransferase domain-containing protein [Bradyrhizobium sp. U87765 SZCCT0109]MBR1349859.1 methyltransferase d